MQKSLEAQDITVTHGSGIVVSPFDCSVGTHDDNDSHDRGAKDVYDDEDRC
jgi:hypothetical protein